MSPAVLLAVASHVGRLAQSETGRKAKRLRSTSHTLRELSREPQPQNEEKA